MVGAEHAGTTRHLPNKTEGQHLIADLVLSQIDVHNRLVLADSFSEGLGPGKCDGIAGKIHLLWNSNHQAQAGNNAWGGA